MAWLAVEVNGLEVIFEEKPERNCQDMCWYRLIEMPVYNDNGPEEDYYEYGIVLPKGTIKKLLGYELTWKDEPVKL